MLSHRIMFSAVPVLSVAQLEYVTYEVDNVNQSSYTFSSTDIGSAASDRLVIVVVHWEGGTVNLSSVDIAGSAATEAVTSGGAWGGGGVGIYYRAVSSGSTADIGVTLTDAPNRCAIATWRLTGQTSNTPYDTTSVEEASSGTGLSVNIDVPADGVVVAGQTNNDPSIGLSWTGVTEAYNEEPESNSTASGGSYSTSTAVTNHTVSTSHSSDTNKALSAVSWQ